MSGPTGRARPLFAVITKNRTNPAYVGARLGVDRILADAGADVAHFVPDTPDDIDEQTALVDAALALRPDVMIFAPAHTTRMRAAVDKIVAAGVPMFCIVSNPDPSPAITFVGSDDAALGHAMGVRMAEHLGGTGRVAIVDGHPNAATSAPRARGFRAALRDYPGITLVGECRGDYQRDTAEAAFADLLRRNGPFDGAIVANDFMALGVIDALEAAGHPPIPLIGANVTPEGVALIKSGRLIASAAFDALSMGAIAVEAAMRHRRGEPVPRVIELPAQLVDRDNLAAWDCGYEDRTPLTWDEAVMAEGAR